MNKLFYYSALVFLILSINWQEGNSQDARFSQFYAAPLQTNPAMTGVFEGRWRVNANYRDQWSSVLGSVPFRTIGASYDMRYKAVKQDYFAFGIHALRDEAGDGHFIQNRAYLNLSYLKKIGGTSYGTNSQYLVAGAQIGGGQNQIQYNNFWFSEQFDLSIGGFPNTSLSNREPGVVGQSQNSDLFLDFNAGLLYYIVLDDNKSFYLGGAMHHLSTPEVSFFGNSGEVLRRRVSINLGGEIGFNDQMSILPAALFMKQGPVTSTTVGANIRYNNHDWNEIAIRGGVWPHLSSSFDSRVTLESIAAVVILELNRWNVGISYDITTSNFNQANNARGGFELSLIYTQPATSRVRVNCPKF